MIKAHYPSGDVVYEAKRLPVVPHLYIGIIREDLRPDQQTDTGTSNTVQARKLNDTPKIGSKGDVIVVSDAWYLYMKKLMSQKAWEWWGVWPCMLMINRESKWYDETSTEMPKFECIGLPLNFIASNKMVNGFASIVSRDSRHFDTSKLDPAKDNWYFRPWEYHKATTHNTLSGGDISIVGSGFHVYHPVIREEPEIWIQSDFVEWFPALPMDVTYQGRTHTITGYCLQGASVYGHAAEMDIPLRLARVPGELIHPCPEWRLIEQPVPPEIRQEWQ